MEKVDFSYVGKYGFTIYKACFQEYLIARYYFKRPEAVWSKVVTKMENVFEYLVEQGTKHGFNVDSVLEIPGWSGETCFSISAQCSEKISKYFLGRQIKVNSIKTDMMIPAFKYPDLAIQMMKKGINPHIISYFGNSQIALEPSSFVSEEAKQLLTMFPRSVHFSVEDINCDETCPVDCSSKFQKFYYKNDEFVKMTGQNKIGQGGFGSVFKGSFHGKEKAMKCVSIGRIEIGETVQVSLSYFEKNISEIRIQIATAGSGVIVPEAFVRQQNQQPDENGQWIAKNYNVYVYPLYDCNLYELHERFNNFSEKILGDIINQCFIRNGFQSIVS